MDVRLAEVLRLFERYLIEIVEHYDLCPWARSARVNGEVGVEVLWGTPSAEAFAVAAKRLLAQPKTRVAMVLAPEGGATVSDLRGIRTRVIELVPGTGVADFHPDAPLDLASAGRLVPFLRRSPDPLIQLVPLSLMESMRGDCIVADLAMQADILSGKAELPREDVADQIAARNHARVAVDHVAMAARFAEIAEDRRVSYARVGITTAG